MSNYIITCLSYLKTLDANPYCLTNYKMPLLPLPASIASQNYLNSFVISGYTKCQPLSRKAQLSRKA